MFKLALDTHTVGLIEEIRSYKPHLTPSMIVEHALVKWLDKLDQDQTLVDDVGLGSDLLELLCTECDESWSLPPRRAWIEMVKDLTKS